MIFEHLGTDAIILINDGIVKCFVILMSHLVNPKRLLSHHSVEDAK